MSDISKFQFKGYIIKRSLIELNESSNFENIKVTFKVSGLIQQEEKIYLLNLFVKITNEEKDLLIEIDSVGKFVFDDIKTKDEINSYFYINSSAILFPYIRAYISTLTNLSGNKNVTLPTMNLSSLANELKLNTKTV
jgi:preprotein translocase subunit SecB